MLPATQRTQVRGWVVLFSLVTSVFVCCVPTLPRVSAQTPKSAPQPTANEGEPKKADSRLESYKLNSTDAEFIANVITQVYRDTNGIKITVDKQRGLLLVVAPKEVHGLIRAFIKAWLDSAANTHRPGVRMIPWGNPFAVHDSMKWAIERGMKADELELRTRFRRSILRSGPELMIPHE